MRCDPLETWRRLAVGFREILLSTPLLCAVLLSGIAIEQTVAAVAVNQGPSATNSVSCNALLLLKGKSLAEMYEAIREVENAGVRVLHVFPPRTLICDVPAAVEPAILAQRMMLACHRQQVQVPDEAGPMGDGALGIKVWNRLVEPVNPSIGPEKQTPATPLGGDAFLPPDQPLIRRATVGAQAPTANQTSEFMVGRVAVGIILPESAGSGENWSSARQDTVIQEIAAGCNWWATRGGASAHLTYYYDIHRSVPTQYEPIQLPQSQENLWISETLLNLGYTGTSRFAQCRNYDNAIRTQLHTDWGFTIFVVDSLNDGDGKFSDGSRFAYAYFGGPFLVMTYDNDGYGIADMDVVTSHEMGHIFGAEDEYSSSGCSCTETSGYLNVANGNCANCAAGDSTCIMRGGIRGGLCTYTKGQIGWRDSDGDNLFDPTDTSITLTLSPNPAGGLYAFSGVATDVPFPSPARESCSINTITSVDYRVDGGAWLAATPGDGAFNSAQESYRFTAASVPPGSHTLQVRAQNSAGNVGSQQTSLIGYIVHVDRSYPGTSSDGSVNAPYKTVTTGNQAAQNGNTIRITGGNYPEGVSVTKSLRIEGTNGIVNVGR